MFSTMNAYLALQFLENLRCFHVGHDLQNSSAHLPVESASHAKMQFQTFLNFALSIIMTIQFFVHQKLGG
jgi:hypothetical protein